MRLETRRTRARLRAAAILSALLLAASGCGSMGGDGASAQVDGGGSPSPAGDLAGRVIAIDPGHNGGNAAHPEEVNKLVDVITKRKACDTTGTETNDGYPEHEFNWDVARRLTDLLEARGATVVLTRSGDDGVGPCITDRADTVNESGADAAVSIHADGGSAEGHGFHIMVPKPVKGGNDGIVKPSLRLAVAVRDAYEEGTGLPPSNYIGDEGINPRDDMGGLNLSRVPKIMMECANMRNAGDAAKLKKGSFRQRIAEAIADGIAVYLAAEG